MVTAANSRTRARLTWYEWDGESPTQIVEDEATTMQPITRAFIEIVSNLIALAVAVAIVGYWFHLTNDSFSNGAIIATVSYIAAYIGWKLYSRSAGRKRKESGSTSTT